MAGVEALDVCAELAVDATGEGPDEDDGMLNPGQCLVGYRRLNDSFCWSVIRSWGRASLTHSLEWLTLGK